MAAAPCSTDQARRFRRVLGVLAAVVVAAAAVVAVAREEVPLPGPTVDERIAGLRTERASLQARADSETRIGLLSDFRAASLLLDALVVRSDSEGNREFDDLPAFRREAFAELEALNAALKDALDRPGEGARVAARKAAAPVVAQLDRMAGDSGPVVLSYTPRFVPPRRATGELTLAPGAPGTAPQGALRLDGSGGPAVHPTLQAVPRYAPDFTSSGDDDPPLEIEIVASQLASVDGPPPVLAIGPWRGQAMVAPGRLRFVVPRAAFPTDARRTSFAAATLSVRHDSRTMLFQLLFTVLPDRPGSFALDQRMVTTTSESNTLVSPEILARAPAGETRTVRRCFDPPAGWRFDKQRQRVVIVERLGWQDDTSDPTMNAGSVEFVPAESPGQVCIAVIARPVMRSARTATIGRFEATLVRDRPSETTVKSGVRALDWREAVRVPIEPGMVEWKLYMRLFDDIDLEFAGTGDAGLPRVSVPFLHIGVDGQTLVLRADPTAMP